MAIRRGDIPDLTADPHSQKRSSDSVQRRTSRQCVAICGIGRRRTRVGMARTTLSPCKGGHLGTKREAPRSRARTMLCLNHNLHCEYGQHHPPPLPYIRHSLSFVLTSWPPTYESAGQRDIGTFFESRSQLYPYTKTLPRKCSGNNFLDNAHPQNNTSVPLPTCMSDWQERIFLLGEPRACPWRSLVRCRSNHDGYASVA